MTVKTLYYPTDAQIQGVPGGKVSILGGHSIGHSKKCLYEHVSDSDWFPRERSLILRTQKHYE